MEVDTGQDSGGLRFGLKDLLYASALLGSAFALFGTVGVLPGVAVLVLWATVFGSRTPWWTLGGCCCALLAIGCSLYLLAPKTSATRAAAYRGQCAEHLKQIGLALQNYHSTHGTFPPAYLTDRRGRPAHSWRVVILPFLGEDALYKRYSFQEPWNGPTNRLLAEQMPDAYRCPSSGRQSQQTSYLAVRGPRTMWPDGNCRNLAELNDPKDATLLVAEFEPTDVHWMAPEDTDFSQAVQLLSGGDSERGVGHFHEDYFFVHPPFGGNLLFADGSVRFHYYGLSQKLWTALLTIDDGRAIGDHEYFPSPNALTGKPMDRLKYNRFISLGVFTFLTLFPLARLRKRRQDGSPR